MLVALLAFFEVFRCFDEEEVGGCLPTLCAWLPDVYPPMDARLDIPSEFFELRLPVCATYYDEALPAIALVVLPLCVLLVIIDGSKEGFYDSSIFTTLPFVFCAN